MSVPSLNKIIELTLLAEKPLDGYIPKPKFRPSYLGTPCLRKIYYSYMRVEPDSKPNLKGQKIFRTGDAIGGMLCQMFRDAKVLVDYYKPDGTFRKSLNGHGFDYEFPLYDNDLEMSSKVDAVLVIDGKLWLGEWKSISGKKFKDLKAAKPEHVVQGAMYLYLFKVALAAGKFKHIKELEGITDVEGVIFLYVNKEDLDTYKEFAYTNMEPTFVQTVEKIVKVQEHVAAGTLPPTTQDWCQYCDYQKSCLANFKVELPNKQILVESDQKVSGKDP